ncbi:MAG: helix-turn-helix transcriptional regulator [Oscillospiraceae bacterium]|nr:helix-turn-helix transcriptional regulator [Oscillospiraceae bacterium]
MNKNRLRDLREDNDLTQKQVAQALFVHLTQYRRYETGERDIPLELACQIADFYRVSLDYLAGMSDYNKRIEISELNEEQKKLLTNYRRLNEKNKIRINERILTLLETQNKS